MDEIREFKVGDIITQNWDKGIFIIVKIQDDAVFYQQLMSSKFKLIKGADNGKTKIRKSLSRHCRHYTPEVLAVPLAQLKKQVLDIEYFAYRYGISLKT